MMADARHNSADAATADSAAERYEPLMSLTVRHEFYGEDRGVPRPCPDFAIGPTPPSQNLLRYLGLIARPHRTGIDILYRRSRCGAILNYLWQARRRRVAAAHTYSDLPRAWAGSWSRIGLTFSLSNAFFSNFTELPSNYIPGATALYFSNRSCVAGSDGAMTLAPRPDVVGVLQPGARPGNYEFLVDKNASKVVLHDTSGRALLYACKDVEHHQFVGKEADDLVPPRAELVGASRAGLLGSSPASRPNAAVHGTLGHAAAGLYTVRADAGDGTKKTDFLYFGADVTPLLYADLYFASPETAVGAPVGCFPIDLPADLPDSHRGTTDQALERCIASPARRYEIAFTARKTTWIYYVVLPSNAIAVEDVAIETIGANGPQFQAAERVQLPTGAQALRFVATQQWPLRHRPDVALRLRAATSGNGAKRTLLERLPVPTPDRIGFAGSRVAQQQRTATSEIYVYV